MFSDSIAQKLVVADKESAHGIERLKAGENRRTLAEVYATFNYLPGLKALWVSGPTAGGAPIDRSGTGQTLTATGTPTLSIYNDLLAYVEFNGTTQYLSRSDDANLDITGTETSVSASWRGMTMGGWFWLDNVTNASQGFMGKGNATGNQLGYRAFTLTNDDITFEISPNGTVASRRLWTSNLVIAPAMWNFLVFRFNPSTEMKAWLNDREDFTTTSVPASIFNNSAAFVIGATDAAPSNLMDGRFAFGFVCNMYLPDVLISHLYRSSRVVFQN